MNITIYSYFHSPKVSLQSQPSMKEKQRMTKRFVNNILCCYPNQQTIYKSKCWFNKQTKMNEIDPMQTYNMPNENERKIAFKLVSLKNGSLVYIT